MMLAWTRKGVSTRAPILLLLPACALVMRRVSSGETAVSTSSVLPQDANLLYAALIRREGTSTRWPPVPKAGRTRRRDSFVNEDDLAMPRTSKTYRCIVEGRLCYTATFSAHFATEMSRISRLGPLSSTVNRRVRRKPFVREALGELPTALSASTSQWIRADSADTAV